MKNLRKFLKRKTKISIFLYVQNKRKFNDYGELVGFLTRNRIISRPLRFVNFPYRSSSSEFESSWTSTDFAICRIATHCLLSPSVGENYHLIFQLIAVSDD